MTFVKVYRGAAGDKDDNGTDFQDKLLILTKKHIIMADFDPRSWSFPINWSLRREIYLKQHARKMRRLEDIINRTEKETKQQNLLQERQKVSGWRLCLFFWPLFFFGYMFCELMCILAIFLSPPHQTCAIRKLSK